MPSVSSIGQPTLFFNSNHAAEDWRLKEKIVALIESFLQPVANPYTFSDARLPDVIGSTEQTDVVFSVTPDLLAAFAFVEVRDRKEKVGRPYVQEIMGKRESLGVPSCIIASTKGFSRDAIALATSHGILLRVLNDSTPSDETWYQGGSLRASNEIIRINRVIVLAMNGDQLIRGECEGDQAPILAPTGRADEYQPVPIGAVLQVDILSHKDRTKEQLAKVPRDGHPHEVVFSVEYKKPRLTLDWEGTLLPVKRVIFLSEVGYLEEDAPFVEAYRYLDPASGELLAQALLARVNVEGQNGYACLVRHHVNNRTFHVAGGYFA